MHSHLPGNMREHLMTVFQFYTKHGVWQRFDDLALDFDCLFFRQNNTFQFKVTNVDVAEHSSEAS